MGNVKIITSQRYANEEIIKEKRNNKDYTVTLSPSFEYDGDTYAVVLDGHHSYNAAIADGVDVDYVEADNQDCDYLGLIEDGDIDAFLAEARIDDDYYYIDSGAIVW